MSKTSISNAHNYAFYFKTIQSKIMKQLHETIKSIVRECCIDYDPTGIRISAMNDSKTVALSLKLDGDKFDIFYCPERKRVGVNMVKLLKIMKNVKPTHVLSMWISKKDGEDSDKLSIGIEDTEKGKLTTYELNTCVLDEMQQGIPPMVFDTELTWGASQFQEFCREFKTVEMKEVEITLFNSQLIAKAFNSDCSQKTIIDSKCGITIAKTSDDDQIFQGTFNVDNLEEISKCTNLNLKSEHVMMCFKNDYPLVLIYRVGELGEIKFLVMQNVMVE